MKLVKMISAGALAALVSDVAVAAHPPLDRPTPPPCCADGICHPNPMVWGCYQTNWRRWPTEQLEPTPAKGAAKPGQPSSELAPFETLPPEMEDRKAPPPTKPRSETEGAQGAGETPRTGAPGTGTEAPQGSPYQTSPRGPSTTPPPPSMFGPGSTSPTTPAAPTTPGASPFGPAPGGPSTSPLAPPAGRMPWENGGESP